MWGGLIPVPFLRPISERLNDACLICAPWETRQTTFKLRVPLRAGNGPSSVRGHFAFLVAGAIERLAPFSPNNIVAHCA